MNIFDILISNFSPLHIGNVKGQQMRISILILGFKGLTPNSDQHVFSPYTVTTRLSM